MNTLAIIAAVLIVVAVWLVGLAIGARRKRIRAVLETYGTPERPAVIVKNIDGWVTRLAAGSPDDPADEEAHFAIYNALNNEPLWSLQMNRPNVVRLITHLSDQYMLQFLTPKQSDRKTFWFKVVQEARVNRNSGTPRTAPAAA